MLFLFGDTQDVATDTDMVVVVDTDIVVDVMVVVVATAVTIPVPTEHIVMSMQAEEQSPILAGQQVERPIVDQEAIAGK